jgi:hypothetical protein
VSHILDARRIRDDPCWLFGPSVGFAAMLLRVVLSGVLRAETLNSFSVSVAGSPSNWIQGNTRM